jgi:hypothetical protein
VLNLPKEVVKVAPIEFEEMRPVEPLEHDNQRLVRVASYGSAHEASLAQNLLEREGIRSLMDDGDTQNLWGMARLNIGINLRVQAKDAARASALLAAAELAQELDEDWEDQAESTAVCTLCGEPLLEADLECSACATPREGIRTTPSSPAWPRRRLTESDDETDNK